jgi:hypothetical protein
MTAPFGGLAPTRPEAAPPNPAANAPVRYASRGVKRRTSVEAVWSFHCRNGDRSSRIQNALPAVDAIRSPLCTFRSVMGVSGRFIWNFVHSVPPLNDR